MKKKRKKSKKKTQPQSLGVMAFATLVGAALAFMAARWIAAGRIEYWTGSTERHHFIATPESMPLIYWTLILVFSGSAATLWAQSIGALITRLRSRSNERKDVI